jgi:hypothetical protein
MSESVQNRCITLRSAAPADLDAINTVIERAVQTWELPHRVKRLALVSYRDNTFDLDKLFFLYPIVQDHRHTK